MSETQEPKDQKKVKAKGPIRFEAIVPVLVLSLLTYCYFSFYFDRHMKTLVEYVGTQANGAEVNVDSVRTSFLRGSFDLDRLQVTDAERPTHNTLEIGNVHFSYLWDALLRMKFVVTEASINSIMLASPRSKPGHVLPPKPASPSKLEALQQQVMAQVKNRYGGNVLGDALALLEGGDYKDQLQEIRDTLKSEARVKGMIQEVTGKKEFWDKRVKELSDTSKVKEIEKTFAAVRSEKNVLQQAQGVKKLSDLLGDVQKQYKEIEKSSKQLETEVKAITRYPEELQELVNQDIATLKSRFAIPQVDFQDMAMHLFAGQFAEYIAKARKYQALAEQYLPEKKTQENEVIPPKRAEGKNYQFPITAGYPLFWLKKAALSSKGTKDSYSGQVSGELTNVTTSPSQIGKPVVLDLNGDFPASNINGVRAVFTADFTKAVGRQSAMIQVNSFKVPERLFVNDSKLKFGFLSAVGSTTFTANLQEQQLKMNWSSALTKPQFLVETSNKLAKEMLTNIVNGIPVITINGNAQGTFANFSMDISSNLGSELSQGFTREIGAKVAQAQEKINALVEEKILRPKQELMSAIGGSGSNLKNLGNLQKLYKDNEDKIKAEIAKLKSGGGMKDLKERGKKLLKGIKF